MSLITTAIIAGATAGLTGVASQIVQDLYSKLKKNLADLGAEIDYAALESDPTNPTNQSIITDAISGKSIENDDGTLENSKKLIQQILDERVPIDKGVLIKIGELRADEGIVLEDIDLDQRLLEAEIAVTRGEFRVSGVRSGSGSGKTDVDAPGIKIDNLEAGEANFFLKTIYSIPKKTRFVIGGVLATVLAILALLLITSFLDDRSKRKAFDDAVSKVLTSDYRSSVNYVLSVIPDNVVRTRNNDHWQRFSYSWNKHVGRLEELYDPIARGLVNDTMRKGEEGDWVCGQIGNILTAHFNTVLGVNSITGLNIGAAGNDMSILQVFGPTVEIPNTQRMETIYREICDGNVEDLRNPPDLRSEAEKREDELATFRAFVSELEELQTQDFSAKLEEAQVDFLNRYAGYLAGQGMFRADAIGEARVELRGVMSGGGYHYTIPGMNDIVDRIRFYERQQRRDIQGEIDVLQQRISELQSE